MALKQMYSMIFNHVCLVLSLDTISIKVAYGHIHTFAVDHGYGTLRTVIISKLVFFTPALAFTCLLVLCISSLTSLLALRVSSPRTLHASNPVSVDAYAFQFSCAFMPSTYSHLCPFAHPLWHHCPVVMCLLALCHTSTPLLPLCLVP